MESEEPCDAIVWEENESEEGHSERAGGAKLSNLVKGCGFSACSCNKASKKESCMDA
jgi:hypothetical protein